MTRPEVIACAVLLLLAVLQVYLLLRRRHPTFDDQNRKRLP